MRKTSHEGVQEHTDRFITLIIISHLICYCKDRGYFNAEGHQTILHGKTTGLLQLMSLCSSQPYTVPIQKYQHTHLGGVCLNLGVKHSEVVERQHCQGLRFFPAVDFPFYSGVTSFVSVFFCFYFLLPAHLCS